MRRTAIIASALVLFTALIPAASQAVSSGLTVPLDQSRRVPFAGAAASVIPGNADLIYSYIVSPTDVRVVGRKLGVTNLVVLDSRGATLFDREIVVSAGDGSVVTIYRGGTATDYACSPYCTAAQGNAGFQASPNGATSGAAGGIPGALGAVGQALGSSAPSAAPAN